mgnify:CR=1 FL=1
MQTSLGVSVFLNEFLDSTLYKFKHHHWIIVIDAPTTTEMAGYASLGK